jgi:hypothetical protein
MSARTNAPPRLQLETSRWRATRCPYECRRQPHDCNPIRLVRLATTQQLCSKPARQSNEGGESGLGWIAGYASVRCGCLGYFLGLVT